MLEMLKYLKARYVSEKAQGIVEYALILAFVVVIAAGLFGMTGIESAISNVFTSVKNLLRHGSGKS